MECPFPNPLAKACKRELLTRARTLEGEGYVVDPEGEFSAQLYILRRALDFPFDAYPDYTCPWHVFLHPPEYVRWQHLYHIIVIVEQLRQPTGAHIGEPIVLQAFQILMLWAFLGPENPENRARLVRKGLFTIARKNSKPLRIDEPIPTPEGWVANGDIQEGDTVFGADGLPCTVTGAYPIRTPDRAYRLVFSDDTSIEAGGEHLWLTRHKWHPWDSVKRDSIESVVTTEQIAQSLVVPHSGGVKEYNHSIRLPAPVDYPPQEFFIDPYALGVWLAAGHRSSARVALADIDAPHILARIGLAHHTRRAYCGHETSIYATYHIGAHDEFSKGLRGVGVSGNKHIPDTYLRGSIGQRRDLLQGFMDSVGSARCVPGTSSPFQKNTTSTVSIVTEFETLSLGILELARSLGFNATFRKREETVNGRAVGEYFSVSFTAYLEDRVFSLPRKVSALEPRPEKTACARYKRIVACRSVTPTPMRCIAVDSPGNLYLAGRDYTVTHNTATIAAGLISLMSLDPNSGGYFGQEIQIGASDREQAGITYGMCQNYVDLDTVLDLPPRYRPTPSKKTLKNTRTLTELKCLSSDAYRAHGANPCIVVLDELGNVPAQQALDFYSVTTSGFGAQDEPLTLMLSTQAPDDQHFFSEVVDRARRTNEGMLEDPEFAGFVFSVPEQDASGNDIDPFDEDYWYLGNPGLGSILSLADMRSAKRDAQELPSLKQSFRNLRLNQRVSEVAAFLTRDIWAANSKTFDLEGLAGRTCSVGVDFSETTDLTSLVCFFEPIEELGGVHPVVPFFWMPGNGIRMRSRMDKVPYDVWAERGLIDIKSVRSIDYARVAEKFVEIWETYNVVCLGYDRYRMKFFKKALKDLGFDTEDDKEDPFFIEIGQGFKDQDRSVSLLEQKAIGRQLAHANNPILKWNVANAVLSRDPANSRKFNKVKSFGRIDGCVALAIAIHAWDEKVLISDLEDSDYNRLANDPDAVIL